MAKIKNKIEKTNSLAPFYNATIIDICLWIICYTEGNDIDKLKGQDRYTLIEYVNHVQFFQGDELTPMPFERWLKSDQDDIGWYQNEQENKL